MLINRGVQEWSPMDILRAQKWESSLGLTHEVCCNCCSSNGDFWNKIFFFFFFHLGPGFFCFRSEEETFFMGIFTRCLTHKSDRPVPKVG